LKLSGPFGRGGYFAIQFTADHPLGVRRIIHCFHHIFLSRVATASAMEQPDAAGAQYTAPLGASTGASVAGDPSQFRDSEYCYDNQETPRRPQRQ
jgi:hypothetical protein